VPLEDCCPACGEVLAFCECWDDEDPYLDELDEVLELMDVDDDGDEFSGGGSGGGGGGASY